MGGARKKLTQCVEVTGEIMMKIIRKLREERIPYMISPFESDAQLTHLVNNNFVDFVISEDSDLIPFGAEKVLFKFGRSDPKSKNMNMYYERSKLLKVDPHFPDITAWRRMCIISGCDYLPNLPGIGLQKARFLMTAFQKATIRASQSPSPEIPKIPKSPEIPKSPNIPVDFYEYLRQLPIVLRKNISVSDEYMKRFKEAELTFQFQLVYDLKCKKMVPLNPYNGAIHEGRVINILNLPCAGRSLSPELSYHHSLGNLNESHDGVNDATFDPGRRWLCDIKNDFRFLIDNVGYHNLSSSPIVSSPRTPSLIISPRTPSSVMSCSPYSPSSLNDSKVLQGSSCSNKRKSMSPEMTPKRGRPYRGFGDCPFLKYPNSSTTNSSTTGQNLTLSSSSVSVESKGKVFNLSSQGSSQHSSFDSFTSSPPKM